MMTLRQLAAEPPTIPTRTGWYLADLGEAKGKYELYTRQSPQKLRVLREHALIESAVSSNRIEGKQRVGEIKSPRGAKTELVEHALETITGDFGLTHLERLCPGVSRDMIRLLLRDLKAAGRVECIGRGPGAKWRKRVLPLKEGKKGGNNQNA